MIEANTRAKTVLRGVLGGLLTGTVLSGLILGTASVMTDLPSAEGPVTGDVEVPEDSAFSQPLEDRDAVLPGTQDTPEIAETPTVSAPEPDDLSSMEGTVTDPAALPETGDATAALTPPDDSADDSSMMADSDSAVLPSPQTLAPEEPSDEEELSISTEPAQPAEPVAESAAFPEDGADDAATEAEVEMADPVEATGDAESTETEIAAMEAADVAEDTDSAEKTEGTIGDMAEEVTTNRLPSVGDEAAEAETGTEAAAAAEAGEAASLPPLEQFAAPFDNADGKPLMAIVLLDDGQSPIGFDALAGFPYPISYAVDASWSGAADAAAKYRAAGLEVLAMVNLPEGASAVDTEVAMQAYLDAVPEAVAIMEGTGAGLQSNREASAQLVPILLDSGHGLVLFPNGLDTTQKLIAREGVPAASVFRDFDAKGQNASVIRRFLDQAAFKAGQENSGVIMVGRLRAETISALMIWGLQDRAGRVALAPVSAVLMAGQE